MTIFCYIQHNRMFKTIVGFLQKSSNILETHQIITLLAISYGKVTHLPTVTEASYNSVSWS